MNEKGEKMDVNNKKMNYYLNKIVFSIVEKLNDKQFDYFVKMIKNNLNDKQIDELKKYYASKHLIVKTLGYQNEENLSWVQRFYKNELGKINFALNNKDLIQKTKGIKIFLYGKTGTGKTTLVNEIIKSNKNYSFEKIDFINIISSKMGQSQINLMALANNLNLSSSSKKTILFLDELDSIVTNRNNSNDLGEHQRIVATFMKFLDELNENIVFIAATNIKANIDEAILRRFNILVESKSIVLENVIEILKNEINFELTTNELTILKSNIVENSFTFSDVQTYISRYNLDTTLGFSRYNWAHFLLNFRSKFQLVLSLTDRRVNELKMEEKQNV